MRRFALLLFLLVLPAAVSAQRELHWDSLSVVAHLNADGSLQIAETQTMVFSGDWNGGERTFDIRPRQQLSFEGLSRWNGTAWQPMTQDSSLGDVDDYALNDNVLRWRSRLPSDPPFNRTAIRYELRYTLSGILSKDVDTYTLDHDFAFPDRTGAIEAFDLRLTLDPDWQPLTGVREQYTARALAPGQRFVVTVPLRYTGTGSPQALDLARSPAIRKAILVIFGFMAVSILWLFAEEQWKGRFTPIGDRAIDEAWLREHILKFPAELVSAAWDDRIGQAEVVALLARMTAERKLESQVSKSKASGPRMTLRLKVDRSALDGYERALVDRLFFGNRTTTSTDEVKSHYKKEGFNPVDVIQKDLRAALETTFPFATSSRLFAVPTTMAFLAGLGLLIASSWTGELDGIAVVLMVIGASVLAGVATIPGWLFRKRMHWGYLAAVLCLIPALVIAGGVAAFLWYVAGVGRVELDDLTLAGIVALAIFMISAAVNALRSRQRADGIAFRKTLTAGRFYFVSELQKATPALRDEWYPWMLAFELNKEVDDWSAKSVSGRHSDSSTFSTSSHTSTSSSSSSPAWTGFGGGRSGGAGAGATWAAAAGGLAAGVAAPSSSSSGGGSSGGGGGGGSSSGGGGGGGW